MENHVINRLGPVLRKYKDELKSWPALAKEIAKAAGLNEDAKLIDRRTLEKLDKKGWEETQLKITQLVAIDNFLVARGERSILSKDRTLIDSIAESAAVNFLIPARRYPEYPDYVVPWWDFRANTRLMRTEISKLRVRQWHIINDERLRKNDARLVNTPNIAIGSPVANAASEVMMCRMLGIEPRKKCALSKLPFFIVENDRDDSANSAFVRDREESAPFDRRKKQRLAAGCRAFVYAGTMYKGSNKEDYGLLVAQRDPKTGHVQMVLSGLTGFSTYRLARVLQSGQPIDTVPDLHPDHDKPPIFAVLYRFDLGGPHPSGGRRVTNTTAVAGPTLLQYEDGQWMFEDEMECDD